MARYKLEMVCAWMPWSGVYQQQRAFAGGQCTAHFIAEVYVARCIDQVQYIFLPVLMLVIDLDGVALDGNALLSLEIHIVQYLVHHFPFRNGIGALQ